MGNYLLGTIELFAFYFRQLSVFYGLPEDMKTPDPIDDKKRQRLQNFSVSVRKAPIQRYNEEISNLKIRMRELNQVSLCSFRTRMLLLFAVRVATICAAYAGLSISQIFAISLLQFLFAPYSFFVAVTMFVALMFPMYLPHYVVNASLTSVMRKFPAVNNLNDTLAIAIDQKFIWVFFIIDQLLCLICCFYTPGHKSVRFSFSKFLTHFAYGNLNCKTFYLLMWLTLMRHNFHINVLVWFIDFSLGLTPRVARWVSRLCLHWSPLFYHMHRIAHMPEVYEHAHKFHHFLQGTNAFDAHIYGSGMPEEWLGLAVEIGFALWFGLTPLSLNHHSLWLSWTNKVGHTKGEGKDNHHVDHHYLHSKNFSIYGGIFDLVFGTNSDNKKMDLAGYRMERSETDKLITVTYTRID